MSKLSTILDEIGAKLVQDLGEELAQQGHKASGSLIESLRYEKVSTWDSKGIHVKGNDYGHYLEKRNQWRNKMPPIEPLIDWINILKSKGRFSTVKNVRSLAFAIAKTLKKEGMPTINSYDPTITKNGRRIGFIKHTIEKNSKHIKNKLHFAIKEDIKLMIQNVARKGMR